MKNFVKKSFVILSILIGILLMSFSLFVLISFIKYSSIPLNNESLTSPSLAIEIYDKNNDLIKEDNSFNKKYVQLETLPNYVKDAFISIEDKNFYSHKGINLKRIAKAMYSNLKSLSYKEGASTISQQLIKNTHLSGEKTINRKLKEISLTRKLEKNFSKDEILEFYLNIIYFGNNTYGIEEASNYYFSKESKDLSLSETSLLAGLIKSPSKYSPINHKAKAKQRRNLVIDEMAKDNKLSLSEAIKLKNEDIVLSISHDRENKLNTYSEQAIDEAIKILKMPAKHIANGAYKIYTYQSMEMQKKLKDAFDKTSLKDVEYAGISVDPTTGGVDAYIGKSAYKILEHKRQPGSLVKPILVYAPAMEENLISPSTQILDEPLTIGDFSPKNVTGDYKGYISVNEALSKSINVPAVKTLSYLGIEKAKKYGKEMGIVFDKNDDSYSLALGGMTYGMTLQEVATSYSSLANLGKLNETKFINFILDKNGKIVYQNSPKNKQIFREDTAYLCNTMLQDSAKSGTAKKLASLNKPLSSKTGTAGIKGQKQNTDAWNVTFSPKNLLVVWTGNLDNKPISISGGGAPTSVSKHFFEEIQVGDFTKPDSVVAREIDLLTLEENHIISLANSSTPDRYKKTAYFSRFNEPQQHSDNFLVPPKIDAFMENNHNKKQLIINAKKHLTYTLYEDEKIIKEISNSSKQEIISLEDDKTYRLKAKIPDFELENEKCFSTIQKDNNFDLSDYKKKKWYI